MNYFDDENKVIKNFQYVSEKDVFFPKMTENAEYVFKCIHDSREWEKWTFQAGKADPPPDYYNDNLRLMMDIMRVDDHAFVNPKGTVVNPTNARESVLQKEIKDSGILDLFPRTADVIAIPNTKLSTNDDHNYTYYKDSFKHAIEVHQNKIELYKKNHPGYKTIFFVLDESSAYIESKEKVKGMKSGDRISGTPHIQFLDENFISIFLEAEIDYLIWFSPYKLINSVQGHFELPIVAVYDLSSMDFQTVVYETDNMVSAEV